jgi:mRNA interferase RelE/StbE
LAWTVEFSKSAAKALKGMDPTQREKIWSFIKEKLSQAGNPRRLGEPLEGPVLGKYWKYRVGSYRIIADIQDRTITIQIVKIGHRREVYRQQ